MEAEWPTTTPGWQRDVMLLLVAAVFAGEGLLAEGSKSGNALLLVSAVVALVGLIRLLLHRGPSKTR